MQFIDGVLRDADGLSLPDAPAHPYDLGAADGAAVERGEDGAQYNENLIFDPGYRRGLSDGRSVVIDERLTTSAGSVPLPLGGPDAALRRYREWLAHPVDVRSCAGCLDPWLAHWHIHPADRGCAATGCECPGYQERTG